MLLSDMLRIIDKTAYNSKHTSLLKGRPWGRGSEIQQENIFLMSASLFLASSLTLIPRFLCKLPINVPGTGE